MKRKVLWLFSLLGAFNLFLSCLPGSRSPRGEGAAFAVASPMEEGEEHPEVELPMVGNYAPDFTLKGMEGKDISLKGYRGKVVLLNFWATWCKPCEAEMPSMEQIYQDYKDEGFKIMAISVDKGNLDKVESFVKERGFTFPVFLDPSHKIEGAYRIKFMPTTLLIDRKGVIKKVILGGRDWEDILSRSLIENLLNTQ